MFDRTDRQFFAGQDVQGVVTPLQRVLHSQGIPLQQTGATSWSGRGTVPSWGLVPKIHINAHPSQQGFFLDIRVFADVEGNGIIAFILAWFFFFPVAIVLGFVAHNNFVQQRDYLIHSLWSPVGHLIATPNYPPVPFGAPGGAPFPGP
ncbi:MAG TPA: hypothetical protein PKL73_04775 [Polyangiaceae bacterium]|nr:hypothetical protein [Polyangiaceae bacterium]HNZ20812.1 hypothetical protein [Polyangiaceae bacterium]HOD22656.1 hypothetical protein [Polyangiaceae bacterium]HOE48242.1 hypothetical protein [Polyangiaceae bacterium]HOH02944.1 hypothetical protein [Polyangiaceae bacterium]